MSQTLAFGSTKPFRMRLLQIFLTCLPLFLCSCEPSGASRVALATNTEDIVLCCDELDLTERTKIGEFLVQVYEGQFKDLVPSSISVTFAATLVSVPPDGVTLAHTLTSPVVLSVDSGASLTLGSNAVEVLLDDCDFSLVTVDIAVQVVGRRISDNVLELTELESSFRVINTCPPQPVPASPPQELVEAVLGEAVANFDTFGIDTATGVATLNPNPEVTPEIPQDSFAQIFQVGALVANLTQDQLDNAFLGASPKFPSGMGNFGLTLSPVVPQPMVPGAYLLAWHCVQGDIPLDDTDRSLQFSFAFDRDGDLANNLTPITGQENDPLQNTDTFYQAFYNPSSGFSFVVQDGQVTPASILTSSARMVLFNQVQFWVIPLAEFGDPSEIRGRFITFSHFGDFGAALPWSADPTPAITEARLRIDLQPIN